jgi:hypothetical protein
MPADADKARVAPNAKEHKREGRGLGTFETEE